MKQKEQEKKKNPRCPACRKNPETYFENKHLPFCLVCSGCGNVMLHPQILKNFKMQAKQGKSLIVKPSATETINIAGRKK
jgi:hypothetical protein